MTTFYNRKGLCGKEKSSFCRRVVFEEVQEKIDKIVGDSLVTQWEEHSYAYVGRNSVSFIGQNQSLTSSLT